MPTGALSVIPFRELKESWRTSLSFSSERGELRSWIQPWIPISWRFLSPKKVAERSYLSRRARILGIVTETAYSPWDKILGERLLSRRAWVSASKSKGRPTTARAHLGHSFGFKSQPALTLLTAFLILLRFQSQGLSSRD